MELPEEFTLVKWEAAVDFATRAGRTREYVRAIRALWTEAEPSFAGRYVSFGPVKFEPKPAQKPHPPIVFGGESAAALRRAAALGDGWYGVGHTPLTAGEQVARLRLLLATCLLACLSATTGWWKPSTGPSSCARFAAAAMHSL